MLDKRFVIIVACILVTFYLSEWLVPESAMKHSVSFFLTIAVGVLVFWFTRSKMSAKEKETRTKLEQLKAKARRCRMNKKLI